MALLDLSTELLLDIVLLVVQAVGLEEATKLRLICGRFDVLVQDCIFRLPRAILASKRMSEAMRVKLIQSKMLAGNANKLCYTIGCTADYLTRRTSLGFHERYVESLVRLAAKSMIYWDLLDCLFTEEDTQIPPREIRENALVAAAEMNRLQIAEDLIAENVSVASNTRYFGEVLAAAASSGSMNMVLVLLAKWDQNYWDHLRSVRYIHAVEAAAVAGHKGIVIKLLDLGSPLAKPLYDDAIIRTIKANRTAMVDLLLNRRQQHSDRDMERVFWVTLIRTTVEWNNRELLHHIISKDLSTIGEASIGLAVEDGCRKNHYEIVQMLLSALPSFPTREPTYYTGGLFWAARSGKPELLGSLVNFFQGERRQIIRALAGAISGKRLSTITDLLKSAGVDLTNQEPPGRFTDAVRLILPEAFSTALDECSRPLAWWAQNLLEASRSGDLVEVIKSHNTAKVQHPNDDLRPSSNTFMAAAENNHSDILLYLCENQALPLVITSCTSSTAITRILMDFGWDISGSDLALRMAYARSFVHDDHDHFYRWLLDNRASPSARGDMIITPTSMAVLREPMSTIRLFLERCSGIKCGQLLHTAISRANEDVLEVIELLLNLGCPINSIMFQDDPRSRMELRSQELGTPLFDAALRGNTDIVAYLLLRGADPTITSTKGRTPLEVAEDNGYTRIIDLLK